MWRSKTNILEMTVKCDLWFDWQITDYDGSLCDPWSASDYVIHCQRKSDINVWIAFYSFCSLRISAIDFWGISRCSDTVYLQLFILVFSLSASKRFDRLSSILWLFFLIFIRINYFNKKAFFFQKADLP